MKKLAIISALHGDETIGEDIYKTLIDNNPQLSGYLRVFIGNKAAHKLGKRFISTDMNRVFANTKAVSSEVEHAEALRLKAELQSFKPDFILDMHTTKRNAGVFIITDKITDKKALLRDIFFTLPTCILENEIIEHSLVKYYENCISIEVSKKELNQSLIDHLAQFCVNLINEIEFNQYYPLKNWRKYGNRTAIMVPEKLSDMSSSYYGFWGEQI